MNVGFNTDNLRYGKEPIGYIKLAESIYCGVRKKPCLWHLFWMKVLLGWTWHDTIEEIYQKTMEWANQEEEE